MKPYNMNQGLDFTQALKPHYNDVLRYCKALCARWSPTEAEDLLQDALLQAFKNYTHLENSEKFKQWLFQIITRTFQSYTRKRFWRKFLSMDNSNLPEMPSVYQDSTNNDDKLVLREALSKLSLKERSAILLFEIAGFSIEEIADIQNESLSAIKSRLSRARKRLKEYILFKESPNLKEKAKGSLKMVGDIEDETFKLVAEIKTNRRLD
jgi:RNA polymerase sigma-70 factor (ECF subfamily)